MSVSGAGPHASGGGGAGAVERARFPEAHGARCPYDLFLPEQPGARPLAVVCHGFQSSRKHMARLAEELQAQGWVVLVPDLSSLMGLRQSTLAALREHAVANVVAQTAWVIERGSARGADALAGRVDAKRVALVGHSAGGAIVTEVACRMADRLRALLLLDAVPWTRTLRALEACPELATRVAVCVARAPPSGLNADGLGLHILARLESPAGVRDVLLCKAKHGDFAPSLAGGDECCRGPLYRTLGILSRDRQAITECMALATHFLNAAAASAAPDLAQFEQYCEDAQRKDGGHRLVFRKAAPKMDVKAELPDLNKLPYFLR
jgi:dienelactone hydrolase